VLRDKFQAALKDLSKLKFKSKLGGSRYIYELPWYVFIGPPGSGKTTALKALESSGLTFLMASGDKIGIEGMGGTRNCDWVFTNEAVFIDTAGRYVQQGSDAAVDAAAWKNFLNLLKKNRPMEPINGAIVAISLGDLALATEAEIDGHARALRARLDELSAQMGARIPVYVMFTKCDLIAGFTEFFQPLGRDSRDQVWGTTFELGDPRDPATAVKASLATVGPEYDLLVQRLGEMQFQRMQEEQDPQTRARIFGFPAQFASMKPVIERFIQSSFATGLDSQPAMLRGVYFTSATQSGQPVDRLLSRMARDFGLGRQLIGMFTGKPRSYFLGDLLRNVIFPEQGLVRRQLRGKQTSNLAMKIAASALLLLAPVALAGMLYSVWSNDRTEAAALENALADYRTSVLSEGLGDIPSDAPLVIEADGDGPPPEPLVVGAPVADADITRVLDTLAILRTERDRLMSEDADAPFWGMGIDEIRTLRDQADAAYIEALDDLFRTRLLFRLEQLMDARLNKPEELYEHLKAYLMVGGRAKTYFDPGYVRDYMVDQWRADFGAVDTATIATLQSHLDPMLAAMEEGRLTDRPLNDEGVSRAQAAVSQITFAQRAYSAMRRSREARALEPWDPANVGGARTDNVFVRASGVPINDPVPGLFTYAGFWSYALPQSSKAATAAKEEQWLLSESADTPSRSEAGRIQQEILDLYQTEYVERWQAMLRDLRIVSFRDLEHAESVFRDISSAPTVSPWVRILAGVAKETSPAAAPGADSPLVNEATKMLIAAIAQKAQRGSRLLQGGAEELAQDAPGKFVSDTFQELRDFVGDARGGSEIDDVRTALNGVFRKVSDMRASQGQLTLLSGTSEGKQLLATVRRAPDAVREPIVEMFRQIETYGTQGMKTALNDLWTGSILPSCRASIEGRYPFGNGSPVGLIDLQTVLGPNGQMDTYFRTEMARFVDQTRSPWQWTAEGRLLGLSVAPLQFFEKVHRIRRAYFPNGLPNPQVNVGFLPKAFPAGSTAARISIGGQTEQFDAAQFQGRQLAWPGSQPANGALVAISVGGATAELGTEAVFAEAGDWGFFKLLDQAASEPRLLGAGDRARVEFRIQGYPFLVELSLGSSVNPLSIAEDLKGFRCPSALQ
jgi:type VI secretion system protein ImpL